MSSKPVKFAVVGYGHIGMRHADMIDAHEQCELHAVIDINKALEEKVKSRHNVAFFSSLDEFLQAGIEVDVINIATPNSCHAEQAIQCLEQNKHVVVEKPMALSTDACKQVLQKATEHNRHVFGVMQNRYSPPMQWLKKLVAEDVLGKIYLVDIHCYWNRDERYYTNDTWHGSNTIDGGTLYTQFSHYVDLLYWLFGDINDIQARFMNNNHERLIEFEDSAIVQFNFEKQGKGSLIYSTSVWDKNMESSMVILAENGTVKIGGQYMDKIDYCHIKDYDQPELEKKEVSIEGYKGARANHYFVIDNVVDVLRNGSGITTNAEEGLSVVNIIERIYELKKQ